MRSATERFIATIIAEIKHQGYNPYFFDEPRGGPGENIVDQCGCAYYRGESVEQVVRRECRRHAEYRSTPSFDQLVNDLPYY